MKLLIILILLLISPVSSKPKKCHSSGDCSDGLMCIYGRCKMHKTSCAIDADCPKSRGCVDGECRLFEFL